MNIRPFEPGDEEAQADIYNQAAGRLPGFKPATADEVRRRTRTRDFDPASRFYAVSGGRVVGYCLTQPNGRVGYPWCLPGHEAAAAPLFAAALELLRGRGVPKAYAAYRADWPTIAEFFAANDFPKVREFINFALDVSEMPTLAFKPSSAITPMRPDDVPAVAALGRGILRISEPAELEKYLFANPNFSPDSLFVLRSRVDQSPLAAALLIEEPNYADPRKLDPWQPCFRLGAFGTEGLAVKKVNGQFATLIRADGPAPPRMLDLLGYAASRLESTDTYTLSAQVPSDVPALVGAYTRFFKREGSFPVFERAL